LRIAIGHRQRSTGAEPKQCRIVLPLAVDERRDLGDRRAIGLRIDRLTPRLPLVEFARRDLLRS
jgi:hypothetical protein